MSLKKYQSKEVSDLEETLKQYLGQSPDQADFDFDLLKCTWSDVLHEMERAQAAVFKSEDGGKRPHRRIWRSLGDIGSVLDPGLAAIPNNLSVLQGGLAVIFSLARHRSQNRHKLLRAFEDVPSIIMMAYDKAENIPRDQPGNIRLQKLIRGLQHTLLITLPVLIDLLNPGTLVGKATNPFKSSEIDDLLGAIRRSSERVRVCAEGVMDNIVLSTHQTVNTNHKMTNDMYKITQHTDEGVGSLHGKIDEVLEHQKSIETAIDAISGKNGLLSFLMEYLKPERRDEAKSPKVPPPVYEPATPVTPRELLGLMSVHHLGALEDEQHILRRRHSLHGEDISHAATMFQTAQIQQLLRSAESGVVLVNGHADRTQHTKISPITYVCATLTHALRRLAGGSVVLDFYCGQHAAPNDNLVGPQGLMRSLVAFLVLGLAQNKYISDSAPIWFSSFQEDFDIHSIKGICELFARLVELVPRETRIYCVIDGISYYERQGWKDDYDEMMRCFGGIIAKQDSMAVFKLLLTSPTSSHWLPDLEPHQRVSLRNLRTRGGGGGIIPSTYYPWFADFDSA